MSKSPCQPEYEQWAALGGLEAASPRERGGLFPAPVGVRACRTAGAGLQRAFRLGGTPRP
mgnify:CR=1 FL=1